MSMRVTPEERKMLRAHREKLGRCLTCGKRKDQDGFKTCPKCRASDQNRKPRNLARARMTRAAKKASGVCIYGGCYSESVPGRSYCGFHAELLAEAAQARRARLKAEGRCYVCGKEPGEGIQLCPECQKKALARGQKCRLRKRTGCIALPMAG